MHLCLHPPHRLETTLSGVHLAKQDHGTLLTGRTDIDAGHP